MILVGGFESFAAGWVYNIEKQIEILGASIVFTYMTTTFGSVVLACALWFGLHNTDTALWAGFVGWIVSYAIGMSYVAFLLKKKKQADPSLTWKGMGYDLTMRNVMELRSDLIDVVGFMPIAWAVLIKHFIPLLIIILFSLGTSYLHRQFLSTMLIASINLLVLFSCGLWSVWVLLRLPIKPISSPWYPHSGFCR